ncbi:MAG: hypothetical protein HY871_06530 [Chloroflexi bacterium]|nr:hypothetical protein [Chloroflexota bacterium]
MNGLTVGDGFKFGCGFLLSVLVFYVVLIVLASLVMIVLSLVGATSIPLLQQLPRSLMLLA